MNKTSAHLAVRYPLEGMSTPGFDPEMLFVECSRCGNLLFWEEGQATRLLKQAGIDPLELDPHCLLLTDGCPHCSQSKTIHVHVYRVDHGFGTLFRSRNIGHA